MEVKNSNRIEERAQVKNVPMKHKSEAQPALGKINSETKVQMAQRASLLKQMDPKSFKINVESLIDEKELIEEEKKENPQQLHGCKSGHKLGLQAKNKLHLDKLKVNKSLANLIRQKDEINSAPLKSFYKKRKMNIKKLEIPNRKSQFSAGSVSVGSGGYSSEESLASSNSRTEGNTAEIFETKFELEKNAERLGEGCSSVVKVCRKRKNQKLYAVKIMRHLDEELKIRFIEEFHMMKTVKTQGIAKYFELFDNRIKAELYLILELCKGPALDKFVSLEGGKLPEKLALKLLKSLLITVNNLHQVHCIAHRDLHPQNIIVQEKVVTASKFSPKLEELEKEKQFETKILDFNVSKRTKDSKGEPTKLTTKTGNLRYRAPELLEEDVYQYSENVDVSFCFHFLDLEPRCLLLLHAFGQTPLQLSKVTLSLNFSDAQTVDKILNIDIEQFLKDDPALQEVSKESLSLLKEMLKRQDRSSAMNILLHAAFEAPEARFSGVGYA